MDSVRPEAAFEGEQLEAARAIVDGNWARLRRIVRGLDLDQPSRVGVTLLWFAMREERLQAIEALVFLGSQPDAQRVRGAGSALDYAFASGDPRYLAAMLNGGLSVCHARQYGETLLHRAAEVDGAAIGHLKLLLERGADLEARDSIGKTPLMAALDANQLERARYLVEQGANLDVVTSLGESPAWVVQYMLDEQEPGSSGAAALGELKAQMMAKGATFPAEPPDQVRARLDREKTQAEEQRAADT